MKTASAGLIALLNSSTQFIMADLLTITTVGGTVYRFTSADRSITVGANTYTQARFKRGSTRTIIGLEVDTLDLSVSEDSTILIGGISLFQALANGALDGAAVLLDRVFMPTWGDTSNGTLNMFTGRISDISLGRSEADITVKSDIELLETKIPRNLYQSGCVHTLFDSGCTIVKSTTAVTSSVGASSTNRSINSALAQAAGWFDLGTILFTSGLNSGVLRTVKSFASGNFQLSYALPYAPNFGDTFTAHPGCDKQKSTCTTKFSNQANFRGFPYIPTPETGI